MTINPGTKLGSYEILSRIGAGGMGEVWRAKDPKIGRDVAIKVLPASLVTDADRLQRFEQEARAAGTLNHPNLVTIYELGTYDGAPYIAMELLEGETLREKLDRGAIPARKAIDEAVQIANGLAAAHDKGIVHRDLKPENIFVAPDGHIKILDFGLAKLTVPAEVTDDRTARRGTAPGTVMGTAGYMSPEQVRAVDVDHRSDIFSFGAILYEMLSGHRAFKRDSSVETMNAILKEDPPELSTSGAHVSPAIDRIIRRCLEKSPAERFQNARDLSFALEGLSGTSTTQASVAHDSRSSRRILVWAAAGLVLLALMAGLFAAGRWSRPEPAQPTMRQLTFGNGTVRSARFTPDGQAVVYGAAWDGAPLKLFQHRLDGAASVPLALPDGDILGISSKGEMAISAGRIFTGWMTHGTLAKTPLLGASVRNVLDGVSWSDWTPDGGALLIVRRVGNEDRLEYPIGKVLYRTSGYISYPRFSRTGDRIAFLDHPVVGDNRGNVAVITLDGKKTELSRGWAGLEGLAWSADGSEVWFAGSNVGVWTLNAAGGKQGLRTVWRVPSNLMVHDIDRQGRVLVANAAITSTDRGLGRGEQHDHDLAVGWSDARAISNDGINALVTSYTGEGDQSSAFYDLYLRPMNGTPGTRIGEGEGLEFSADGKWALAMIFTTPAKLVLYGTNSEETKSVDLRGLSITGASMTPDGRFLLIANATTGSNVYLTDLNGSHRSRLPFAEPLTGRPVVSPDGLKVAFINRVMTGSSVWSLKGERLRDVPVHMMVTGWASDSRSVFVFKAGEIPIRIQRMDISTGTLTAWKEIIPSEIAGEFDAAFVRVNPDGDAYAYSIERMLTDLYIVEGLH